MRDLFQESEELFDCGVAVKVQAGSKAHPQMSVCWLSGRYLTLNHPTLYRRWCNPFKRLLHAFTCDRGFVVFLTLES